MKTKARILAAAMVLSLAVPLAGQAEQPTNEDLQKQLQALTESVQAMQKDIQEIKKMVAARPAAAPRRSAIDVVVDVADNPTKGPAGAPLTLIEFTDYQCPFCSRYARDTWPKVDAEYVQTGRIRYVVIDVPLESIHKDAFKAAEASACAAEQGKYWEMHHRLFQNTKALAPLSGHASAIGLNVQSFEACMTANKYAAAIRRDMEEARKAGITGTPNFVIAKRENGSSTLVRSVAHIKGAQPFETFKAELDRQLAALSAPGAAE